MSATISINDRLLPGKTRAELVAGVSAAAATDSHYTVMAPSPSTVILTWKHRPTWATVAGIIGFLLTIIGVIFLIVKETHTITLTAIDEEGGVRVSAAGAGSEEMVVFLQGFLDPAA